MVAEARGVPTSLSRSSVNLLTASSGAGVAQRATVPRAERNIPLSRWQVSESRMTAVVELFSR